MPNSIPGTPDTTDIAKAQARRLAKALEDRLPLKHGQALELIARLHAQESWGHLRAEIESRGSLPPFFPAEEALQVPQLTKRDKYLVLFKNRTMAEILTLVELHMGWRGMHQADFTEILRMVAEEIGVPHKASFHGGHFKGISLGALRNAEFLFQQKKGRSTAAGQWMTDAVGQAFEYGVPDFQGTPSDIEQNYAVQDGIGKGLTGYDLATLPVDLIDQGIHGLYAGQSLKEIKRALPSAIDLTNSGIDRTGRYADYQLRAVARHFRTPFPPEPCANPVTAVKIILGLKLADTIGKGREEPAARPPRKRQILILSLSDLVEASGGDILLAQARSMGLFLLIWADQTDLPHQAVTGIFAQINLLIEDGAPFPLSVRSRVLEESKGGILKIPKPWQRLSIKDRAANSIALMRAVRFRRPRLFL